MSLYDPAVPAAACPNHSRGFKEGGLTIGTNVEILPDVEIDYSHDIGTNRSTTK